MGTATKLAVEDEPHDPNRVRVLVVDDSPVSRAYVQEVLTQVEGIDVIVAERSLDALRLLRENPIALVICDYEMPELSGLQVLRFVRQSHDAISLPVLMLTSRDEPDVKVKAFAAGANDYVVKQAPKEELAARVGTQIELVRAHRRLSSARIRQAEHQKFEAIGHLADGLAHELNTPAQYIQDNLSFLAEGFEALGAVVTELRQLPSAAERSLVETVLERIEYDYLAKELPRCIQESKQGIEHIACVVAVMREFARPGLPERGNHSLNEIIRGAIAVTRGQWHQVAELDLELSDSLPAVPCVAVAIKQVVLHALLNAVRGLSKRSRDASDKGRLRIVSRVDGPFVLIEIRDNGRGDPQQMLGPVLDSVVPDSAGQGLAHAHAVIVDQHHGRLEVQSSSEGSAMFIRLPIELRVQRTSPPPG